jgi:hypothetical protein
LVQHRAVTLQDIFTEQKMGDRGFGLFAFFW